MSYNVHALPTEGDRRERLKEIGRLLGVARETADQPDFVVFQEAFGADRDLSKMMDRAGYSHRIFGPEAGGLLRLSSGLIMLTDHVVVREARLQFEACEGFDCRASKGALAVQVELGAGRPQMWIVTTHLQAHSENDSVRVEQIRQLVPWLRELGVLDAPHVFAGDFNFKAREAHASHPSYLFFREQLGDDLHAGEECLSDRSSCLLVVNPPADEADVWISTPDHQFYRPRSAGGDIDLVGYEVTFTEPFAGNPLSDHWARLGRYTLR